MGNCLKTQLNVIVNNNDLPYFNATILVLKGKAANSIATAYIGSQVKAKFLDGNATFVTGASNPTPLGVEIITPNANETPVYYIPTTSEPVRVLISAYADSTNVGSKFSGIKKMDLNEAILYIKKLTMVEDSDAKTVADYSNGIELKFKSFAGCFDNVRIFNIYSDNMVLDIDLAHLSSAHSFTGGFNIRTTVEQNIRGNISDIAQLSAPTRDLQLQLSKCPNVTGTLEDFASAFIAGRNDGVKATLRTLSETSVTYNGNPITAYQKVVTVDSTAPNGYTIS